MAMPRKVIAVQGDCLGSTLNLWYNVSIMQHQKKSFQKAFVQAPGVSLDEAGNVIIESVFPSAPRVPEPPTTISLHIPSEPASEEVDHALSERQHRVEKLCSSREQVIGEASSYIGQNVAATREAYRQVPSAVWMLSTRGKSALSETVRFVSTFTVIFVFLFVGLNYQSFWQILRPHLRPEEERARTAAMEQITDPGLQRKLLRLPSLTVAGMSREALPPLDLLVAPPDTRIVIPKIAKNVPVSRPSPDALEREDWAKFDDDLQLALKDGVVHYPGTARPGQRGNAFYTGHSSYYPWDKGRYKDVFARLPELTIGDEYVIYSRGRAHHYRVTHVFEVMPNDVSVLDQPPGKQMSTLMTCTPIGTTLRRLIVQGEEFNTITGEIIVGELPAAERVARPEIMLPI